MIREPGVETTIISPFTDFRLDMLQRRSPESSGIRVEVLECVNLGRIIQDGKGVTLHKNPIPGYYPYLGCQVDLVEVELDTISPSALYVLKEELERTLVIREILLQSGIDILAPTNEIATITIRVTEISTSQSDVYTINPMLAETSPYDPGNPTVLFDGLHRAALAKLLGIETVKVLLVRDPNSPLQPLPVEWSEINVWKTVPPSSMKKRFRFQSMAEVVLHQVDSWGRFRQGFISLEAERNHIASLLGQHPDLCGPLAVWVANNWEMYFGDLPPSRQRDWALPLVQRYPETRDVISGIIADNWDNLRSGMLLKAELHYLFNFLSSHPNVKLIRWILKHFDELKSGFNDIIELHDFLRNCMLRHHTLDFILRLEILGLINRQDLSS